MAAAPDDIAARDRGKAESRQERSHRSRTADLRVITRRTDRQFDGLVAPSAATREKVILAGLS